MAKKTAKPADPPQVPNRRTVGTQDAAKKRDKPATEGATSRTRKHKRRSEPLRTKHTSTPSESSRSSSRSHVPQKGPTRTVTSPTDIEKPRQANTIAKPSVAPRQTSEHILSPRLGLLRPRSPASSIFSCQTSQTMTSTSSNRTVTQESYNRSSHATPKVDVFKFLEQGPITERSTIYEEDEDWDSDGSSSSGGSCNGSCCASLPELDHDTQSVRSSSLWDSGMSASGDSPEPVRKRPRAILAEAAHISNPHGDGNDFRREHGLLDVHEDAKTPIPGAFPSLHLLSTDAPPAAPSPPPAYQPQARARHVTRDHSPQKDLQGYELLAQKLASTEVNAPQPMYRHFSHLQHRSLLHLQDIITEMEAELKMLDETISQLTTDASINHHPQSRRVDRVHNIGARRHQVLDCLTHHLTQYNQLLASQISPMCASPSSSQIDEYKTWLYKHQPIPANEASFIHQESDLLLVKPRYSAFDCSPRSAYFTGVWSSLMVCLIGMLFYFLPRA